VISDVKRIFKQHVRVQHGPSGLIRKGRRRRRRRRKQQQQLKLLRKFSAKTKLS